MATRQNDVSPATRPNELKPAGEVTLAGHLSPRTRVAVAIYVLLSCAALLSMDRWPFAGTTILAIIVLAPFCEEVLFRGWAWETLAPRVGDAGAWILTSLGFGIAHVVFVLPSDVAAISTAGAIFLGFYTAMGLMFGWARMKEGIWMSIPVHGACNAVFFLLPPALHQAGWALLRSL